MRLLSLFTSIFCQKALPRHTATFVSPAFIFFFVPLNVLLEFLLTFPSSFAMIKVDERECPHDRRGRTNADALFPFTLHLFGM